jgi:hypothetical protein
MLLIFHQLQEILLLNQSSLLIGVVFVLPLQKHLILNHLLYFILVPWNIYANIALQSTGSLSVFLIVLYQILSLDTIVITVKSIYQPLLILQNSYNGSTLPAIQLAKIFKSTFASITQLLRSLLLMLMLMNILMLKAMDLGFSKWAISFSMVLVLW